MSQERPKPWRRFFQFSLLSLLLLMTLVVGLLVAWRIYVAPYEQQRQTMLLVEKLGGRCQTQAVDKWLGRFYSRDGFQNVTLVDVAQRSDPAAYLDQIVRLPHLETLAVGGDKFADEHLAQLRSVKSLRGLVLDTTSVTDEGIAALKTALPDVDVFQSYRRAWMGLADKHEVWNAGFGEFANTYKGKHKDLQGRVNYGYFFTVIRRMDLRKADDASLADVGRIWTLQELVLDNEPVTDVGLEHLTRLTGLTTLSLVGTKVTPTGVAKLRQALPNCEIRH